MVVLADLLVGTIGWKVISHMPENTSFLSKTTYSLLKNKADVLVLGASKAYHGYDANMLSDSLGLETYNCGADGCDMMYYGMMLSGFLTRCKPQIIILDMASLALDAEVRVANYKFLYGVSPVVDTFIKQNVSVQERLKLQSNLYRYNGFYSLFASSCLHNAPVNRGYEPLTQTMEKAQIRVNDHFSPNPIEVKFFKEVVEKARRYHAELYVFVSPSYGICPKSDAYVKALCAQERVFFLNLSQDKRFLNPSYFKDDAHLNKVGAELYTRYIIQLIRTKTKIQGLKRGRDSQHLDQH